MRRRRCHDVGFISLQSIDGGEGINIRPFIDWLSFSLLLTNRLFLARAAIPSPAGRSLHGVSQGSLSSQSITNHDNGDNRRVGVKLSKTEILFDAPWSKDDTASLFTRKQNFSPVLRRVTSHSLGPI